MEDDWASSASAPAFSLFERATPEQAIRSGIYVDPTLYNSWNKSDRRLFRRLKTQQIAEQLARAELNSLDDLTSAFNTLNLIKSESIKKDDSIDDLIGRVERLRVEAECSEVNGVKGEHQDTK